MTFSVGDAASEEVVDSIRLDIGGVRGSGAGPGSGDGVQLGHLKFTIKCKESNVQSLGHSPSAASLVTLIPNFSSHISIMLRFGRCSFTVINVYSYFCSVGYCRK